MKDLKQYAEYAQQNIKHICKTFGKREPGSKSERDAQKYLADEIKKNNWADKTELADFRVNPYAFMLYSKIIPYFMAIGLAFFAIHGVIMLICASLSLLLFIFEFVLYRQAIDWLPPRRISQNLSAVRNSKNKTKRRIIISGHIDAAHEMTFKYLFGQMLTKIVSVICIVGIFFSIALGIAAIIIGPQLWMIIAAAGFLPFYICLLFFFNYSKVVDGAIDNLTGSFVSIAVLKYLADNKITFDNTEVVVLITGSEEAGLRGAKDYVKQNGETLRDPDVETVFVALETLREDEYFAVYSRDLNGLVAHDKKAVALLDKASKELLGKTLPHHTIVPGSSDAAAFTQGKIPAVALAAMDPRPAKYYHSRLDTADNLDVPCMEKAINIILKTVELFDKEGLN